MKKIILLMLLYSTSVYSASIGTITDSAASFVVKQNPDIFLETTPGVRTANKIKTGQLIDLYISAIAPPVRDTSITPTTAVQH